MKKDLKIFLILFISLGLLFLSFLFISSKKEFKENLSYEFNGVVENIIYDVKGIPTVTINKKAYYLSAGYNFNQQIQKGDTLKKNKGSNIYSLTKRKNAKLLLFTN